MMRIEVILDGGAIDNRGGEGAPQARLPARAYRPQAMRFLWPQATDARDQLLNSSVGESVF
jgi:hypothetical protein